MPKKDRPISSIPTYDKDPDRVFKQWQQAGRVPSNYASWDELEADFISRLNDGQTAREARKAMGVEYRSIAGSNLLEKNISSKGDTRGLNRRAIREDMDPITEKHIRTEYGEDKLTQFREKLKNDWFKLSEGERRNVQGMTGAQQHRGHGNAASSGGSISINNMLPENGKRNSLHGPEPRFPQGVMDDIGLTKNYMEDFYEWDLEQQGLSRGTRPSNALAAAGDEQMVSPDRTDPRGYNRNPEAGVAPETFEMQTEKLKQLEQQGISRQTIDNYERNQSAALSIGDSTGQSGPVTVTPGDKTTVKVIEPDSKFPRKRVVGKGLNISDPRSRPLTQLRKAAKGVSKIVPGPVDDLAIGAGVSAVVGTASLLGGAGPVQAAEDAGNTAVDFATGDLDGGSLAPGTVTGQKHLEDQNPNYYGKQGPSVTTPAQSQRAAQLQVNPEGERGYETLGRGLQWGVQKLQELFIR